MKSDTIVEEYVYIDLWSLLDMNIDGLNDYVEEEIQQGILTDIHYQVVGHEDDRICLLVTARIFETD